MCVNISSLLITRGGTTVAVRVGHQDAVQEANLVPPPPSEANPIPPIFGRRPPIKRGSVHAKRVCFSAAAAGGSRSSSSLGARRSPGAVDSPWNEAAAASSGTRSGGCWSAPFHRPGAEWRAGVARAPTAEPQGGRLRQLLAQVRTSRPADGRRTEGGQRTSLGRCRSFQRTRAVPPSSLESASFFNPFYQLSSV
jgi:hypothetical protein